MTGVPSSAIADESFPKTPDIQKSTMPIRAAEDIVKAFMIPHDFRAIIPACYSHEIVFEVIDADNRRLPIVKHQIDRGPILEATACHQAHNDRIWIDTL